jgi:uncharacterized protein
VNGHLPDVNLLLALAWPNHQFHHQATSWFSSRDDLPWHTCAVTQLGFVRLSSNPAFTPYAKTPLESALLLGAMVRHPQHRYVAECAPLDREPFTRIARNLHGHKQVTDAYLAAVAHEHGLALVTFDRRIGLVCPFPGVVQVLQA